MECKITYDILTTREIYLSTLFPYRYTIIQKYLIKFQFHICITNISPIDFVNIFSTLYIYYHIIIFTINYHYSLISVLKNPTHSLMIETTSSINPLCRLKFNNSMWFSALISPSLRILFIWFRLYSVTNKHSVSMCIASCLVFGWHGHLGLHMGGLVCELTK